MPIVTTLNSPPWNFHKVWISVGLAKLTEFRSFGTFLCFFTENVTQPFVQVTESTVTGQRSVTFTCISPDTDVSIRWIFNNNTLYLTERMTLSPTKCGLRINPVKSEDAGEYQCEIFNQVSMETSLPISWPWWVSDLSSSYTIMLASPYQWDENGGNLWGENDQFLLRYRQHGDSHL